MSANCLFLSILYDFKILFLLKLNNTRTDPITVMFGSVDAPEYMLIKRIPSNQNVNLVCSMIIFCSDNENHAHRIQQ